MADDGLISGDLREFIVEYFDSVAQLEAVLLLRDNPSEIWTADKIARRLYISAQDVTSELAKLCEHGLLDCTDDHYALASADMRKRAMIEKLAVIYARHIVPVTNIIHSKPRRIQKFAEAFRIKKDH